MTRGLAAATWPQARLGEALELLAGRLGVQASAAAAGSAGGAATARWLETAAARLNLEAEPVEVRYGEVDGFLRCSGPAILRISEEGESSPERGESSFLVLLAGNGAGVRALGPDRAVGELDPEVVRAALFRSIEAEHADPVEKLLAGARIRGSSRRRRRARAALLDELLRDKRLGDLWLIGAAGTAGVRPASRAAGLPRLLVTLVAAHGLHFILFVASWWLLGRGALAGRLDTGWLTAWALMLLTLIPLRLLATYAGGLLSVRAGALLKRRLLAGALKLDPEEVRHMGAGQLLGRVIESEAVEQLAVTGGLLAVTGAVELLGTLVVLALGAGGLLQVLLLCVWIGVTALIGFRYFSRRREWTLTRLCMTNELVEGMVGHRTRIAQDTHQESSRGEDQSLDRYHGASRSLDGAAARLQALVPRGWFIIGILGLIPAFLTVGADEGLLAIGVGGTLLGFQAFRDLAEGLDRVVGAAVAWDLVKPFWQAASRPEALGEADYAAAALCGGDSRDGTASAPARDGTVILDVRDLAYRHRDRVEPALRDVDLRIHRGDRILLQGPSGSGKSTLAMLLAGCRTPQAGLLLLRGLDLETLGAAAWRHSIVAVPQFHENHVLMGTFAFNALMGKGWPPVEGDMEEAEGVCRSLGLGPLLDRMPSGLLQLVGETGWQLSHGERGRLYMARALLQRADLTIFDESFAALDRKDRPCSIREKSSSRRFDWGRTLCSSSRMCASVARRSSGPAATSWQTS